MFPHRLPVRGCCCCCTFVILFFDMTVFRRVCFVCAEGYDAAVSNGMDNICSLSVGWMRTKLRFNEIETKYEFEVR